MDREGTSLLCSVLFRPYTLLFFWALPFFGKNTFSLFSKTFRGRSGVPPPPSHPSCAYLYSLLGLEAEKIDSAQGPLCLESEWNGWEGLFFWLVCGFCNLQKGDAHEDSKESWLLPHFNFRFLVAAD